jgi:N-acetylglucosaminyldiphosphoundecaprenol N-acetyl-beta-D-mannosaminyltransferase
MNTVSFWGYELSLDAKDKCVEQLFNALIHAKSQHVVTLNPEMILAAEKDCAFAHVLQNATLRIPDGIGLVWALMRQGIQSKRLPGIELSEAIINHCRENNIPVAFIGASPEVMAALIPAIQLSFARLNIVYSHHGFFKAGSSEEQTVLSQCIEAKPQVTFLLLFL